ncbi:MAG: acyltransferase [Kiloniellaceae bacterium]
MDSSLPIYRPFGTFRFLLAIAVVASHTFPMAFPDGHLLHQIGIGNVAVMGFFILSGFIITEALITFYSDRPMAFMGNRLARIVPPYWAALAVSVCVHAALAQKGPVWTSATETMPPGVLGVDSLLENALAIFPRPSELTVALDHPFYGFVRFYWAIYIELLFYGAAFLVAALTVVPMVRRARLAGSVVAAAMAIAAILHVSGEYAGHEIVVFPGREGLSFAPYFLTGVSLYFCLTQRFRMALVGFAASYVLMALHFSRYVQGKVPLSDEWASGLLELSHAIPILLLLAVPAALWCFAHIRAGRFASADWQLGNLSYPIYLNHWVVIVAMYTLTDGTGLAVQAASIAASIALSWVLVHIVETPMRSVRDQLRGQTLMADNEVIR